MPREHCWTQMTWTLLYPSSYVNSGDSHDDSSLSSRADSIRSNVSLCSDNTDGTTDPTAVIYDDILNVDIERQRRADETVFSSEFDGLQENGMDDGTGCDGRRHGENTHTNGDGWSHSSGVVEDSFNAQNGHYSRRPFGNTYYASVMYM